MPPTWVVCTPCWFSSASSIPLAAACDRRLDSALAETMDCARTDTRTDSSGQRQIYAVAFPLVRFRCEFCALLRCVALCCATMHSE